MSGIHDFIIWVKFQFIVSDETSCTIVRCFLSFLFSKYKTFYYVNYSITRLLFNEKFFKYYSILDGTFNVKLKMRADGATV